MSMNKYYAYFSANSFNKCFGEQDKRVNYKTVVWSTRLYRKLNQTLIKM